MSTFSAMALDHMIEPGESKPSNSSDPQPVPSRGFSKPPPPPPQSKHVRRNSSSNQERQVPRPQMLPALYATPAPTPLPDAPSSFPPSPYIINHKRRGPRLLKSASQNNVPSSQGTVISERVNANVDIAETNGSCSTEGSIREVHVNGGRDCAVRSNDREAENAGEEHAGVENGFGSSSSLNRLVSQKSREFEDFFDSQEQIDLASNTEMEDNCRHGLAAKLAMPMGEFFDAPEELSYEGQASLSDIETELREIRLALLMEIEKRKQAEDTRDDIRSQWQKIRQQLAPSGLTLPADLTGEEGTDPAEELCQQVFVARFVSESIGRGIAKAEVEKAMETRVEAKNFEIARLLDRLHYTETVNQEMSQRNQEAVEMARRRRQGRKRKQMLVWGSIAAVLTLGSVVAIAWSCLPARGSSSAHPLEAPERGDAPK